MLTQRPLVEVQPPLFVLHSLMSLQTMPLPVHPALHVHQKEPWLSKHAATKTEPTRAQLCRLAVHSLTLVLQFTPVHPCVHGHPNEPLVSRQDMRPAMQLCRPSAHSFTLLHDVPDPVQPALHAQVKEPIVSLQVAFALQLWVLAVHSFVFVVHAGGTE